MTRSTFSHPWLLPFLALATAFLAAGCGSKSSSARLGTSSRVYPRLTAQQAQDITVHALGLIGTPYVSGGNTPETGFDCSGLIRYVYLTNTGVAPPRQVEGLNQFGTEISARELRTGDLVLFGSGSQPTHAGIYVGGGMFVHAPRTGGLVRKESLHSSHWSKLRQSYRRL